MKEEGRGKPERICWVPILGGSAPCIRQDRDGEQTGAEAKAFVNLILCLESLSIFGVIASVSP